MILHACLGNICPWIVPSLKLFSFLKNSRWYLIPRGFINPLLQANKCEFPFLMLSSLSKNGLKGLSCILPHFTFKMLISVLLTTILTYGTDHFRAPWRRKCRKANCWQGHETPTVLLEAPARHRGRSAGSPPVGLRSLGEWRWKGYYCCLLLISSKDAQKRKVTKQCA